MKNLVVLVILLVGFIFAFIADATGKVADEIMKFVEKMK